MGAGEEGEVEADGRAGWLRPAREEEYARGHIVPYRLRLILCVYCVLSFHHFQQWTSP
jgi:hypothetical protein